MQFDRKRKGSYVLLVYRKTRFHEGYSSFWNEINLSSMLWNELKNEISIFLESANIFKRKFEGLPTLFL